MIRILHTADWHIGQTFFGHDRTAEHNHFFEWLLSALRDNSVDVLLVAGDVFDVSNPSAAAQRELYDFIRRAAAECPHLQMLFIAGNHDSAARLEAPVPLLEGMNTVVHGMVGKRDGEILYDDLLVPLRGSSGDVEAWCFAVPFLRQGDYPSESGDANSYADGVRRFYSTMLERQAERCGGLPIVVMGHMQVTGSEIAERDHSERTVIGGLECVSPSVFADSRIVYTALGHIHKSQRVSGMENVRYAGSPLPMSFAEKHYRHGAVMVTIDGGETKIEKLDYQPAVELLTIPPTGAATPEDVLLMVDNLPLRAAEGAEPFDPYLEIRVLLDEPDPMLPQRISEHLADKAVRLARVVSTFRSAEADGTDDDAPTTMSLQEMNPLQILKAAYQNKYNTELPDAMEQLFNEVCRSVSEAD
jgi:exonuclease SbcD